MRKNLLLMFAAILLCGLAVTMFTSCGGDDEDNTPKIPEEQQDPEEQKPEVKKADFYDITVTVVGQSNLLKVMTSDFTINWVKNGQPNKKVVEFDEEFQGESALDALENTRYAAATKVAFSGEPKLEKEMQNKYIYRMTLKDIAADTKYSYDFLFHVNKDFQIAEGDSLLYVLPMVMVTETAKGTTNREIVEDFYYSGGVVRPHNLARFLQQFDERTPMFQNHEFIVGDRY